MNQKTKTFFIGGLGSNFYHAKDFIEEFDEKVAFLNPYIENLKNEEDLQNWFENEIKDFEEVYLIGHSLDWSFTWWRFSSLFIFTVFASN